MVASVEAREDILTVDCFGLSMRVLLNFIHHGHFPSFWWRNKYLHDNNLLFGCIRGWTLSLNIGQFTWVLSLKGDLDNGQVKWRTMFTSWALLPLRGSWGFWRSSIFSNHYSTCSCFHHEKYLGNTNKKRWNNIEKRKKKNTR